MPATMPAMPAMQSEIDYEAAAMEYQSHLTLENYMEGTPSATQRKITVDSFGLLKRRRPEVHCFNELLIQYPLAVPRGKKMLGQVVPDNMVVLHDGEIDAVGSYNLPRHPEPFLVMEYVSQGYERKDYVKNKRKYELKLKVPYYLLFHPIRLDLILYRHDGRRYQIVKTNIRGRLEIGKLELEVALVGESIRFWHRGSVLRLPEEVEESEELETAARKSAETRLEEAEAKIRQLEEKMRNMAPRTSEPT